jgi:hypothetical protein
MSSYESLSAARSAFIVGRTEFQRTEKAYVVFANRSGAPLGHELVEVLDVTGITGDGQPVYKCLRKTGAIQDFDGTQLHRAQQLLYGPDGQTPTAYGAWYFAQKAREREDAVKVPPSPVPVEAVIEF